MRLAQRNTVEELATFLRRSAVGGKRRREDGSEATALTLGSSQLNCHVPSEGRIHRLVEKFAAAQCADTDCDGSGRGDGGFRPAIGVDADDWPIRELWYIEAIQGHDGSETDASKLNAAVGSAGQVVGDDCYLHRLSKNFGPMLNWRSRLVAN